MVGLRMWFILLGMQVHHRDEPLPSTSVYNLVPKVHATPLVVFIVFRYHTAAVLRGEKRVGQKDRAMGQIHTQGAVDGLRSWAVC